MGLISGILSPIAQYQDRQSRAKAAGLLNIEMQKGYTQAGAQNQQTYSDIGSILQNAISAGDTARVQLLAQSQPEAVSQYLKSNNIDLSKSWDQNTGAFGNSGLTGNTATDVQRFLDPSMDFRMGQGVKAMDASAASKGNLFAGGYGKELQNYSQDLASTEYNNAFNREETVKSSYAKNWEDRLNALQSTRNQQMSQLSELMNGGNQANNTLTGARQNMGNNQMDITMGSSQSTGQNNAAQSMSHWNMGDSMRLLGGVGDAGVAAGAAFAGNPSGLISGFGDSSYNPQSGVSANSEGNGYNVVSRNSYTGQNAFGATDAQTPQYQSGFGSTQKGWA